MHHRISRWLTLTSLLLLSHLCLASQPILLTQGSLDYSITSYLSIYEDKDANLSIEDIATLRYQLLFSPTHAQSLKLGFSNSNFWLRFSVTNPYKSTQEAIFTLSDSDFDLIEFYQLSADGEFWHINRTHNSRAISGSLMQVHNLVLSLPPQSTSTYLVQFHSEGLITAYTHLLSRDQLVLKEQRFALLQGLNSGLVIAAILLFLYQWGRYRLSLAFWASLLGLTILLFQPAYMRFWPFFFDLSLSVTDKIGELLLGLICAFHLACLSSLTFLKKWHSKIRFMLLGAFLLMLISTLSLMLFLPKAAMPLIALATFIASILAIILLLIHDSREPFVQRMLLLGHLLWLLCIGLTLLSDSNYINLPFLSTYVAYLVPIGVLSLLCMALLNQIAHLQKSEPNIALNHVLTPALLLQVAQALRTPINAVLSMTEFLRNSPLAPLQKKFTDSTQAAGQDLLHLSDEVADIALILNGQFETEAQPFTLSDVLHQVVNSAQHEITRKGLKLSFVLQPDLPEQMIGDAKRIQLVLSNLLNFCLTYTEQGELNLSVSPYHDSGSSGLNIQLQILSSMLHPEQLRTTFQLLQPHHPLLEKPASKDWQQLLTRALIEQLHGRLEVESMTSQGAALTLSLPLPSLRQPKSLNTEQNLSGKRLLLVEDNGTLQAVITQQLQRLGIKVDQVNNGRQALALLRSQVNLGHSYDFILLEQDLLNMSGVELLSRINQDAAISPKPPAILLLGLDTQAQAQAKALGVHQFLRKPVLPEALAEALQQLN